MRLLAPTPGPSEFASLVLSPKSAPGRPERGRLRGVRFPQRAASTALWAGVAFAEEARSASISRGDRPVPERKWNRFEGNPRTSGAGFHLSAVPRAAVRAIHRSRRRPARLPDLREITRTGGHHVRHQRHRRRRHPTMGVDLRRGSDGLQLLKRARRVIRKGDPALTPGSPGRSAPARTNTAFTDTEGEMNSRPHHHVR